MTDTDPPAASPSPKRGLRRLLGLGRDNARAEASEESTPEAANAPNVMRLRLAEFEAARVENVMIPRAEIIALDTELAFDDLVKAFAEATHSRLPVYRETLDDPVGFIHIKDVVAAMASDEDEPVELDSLIREILYVPASMRLADLLVKMQATRIHMALVVDEYGGTDGLVSLEDLVEEIVGDIEDEHDDATQMLQARGEGCWEADARMEIEDFTNETGLSLALQDFEDDIDTLGGVAFALAGRVPERGEVLRHPAGADIEIIEADGRRIRRLRLRQMDTGAPEAAE